MRHRLETLPRDGHALRSGVLRERGGLVVQQFGPALDPDRRGAGPIAGGERADERVREGGGVAVDVAAGRGGGPDGAGRQCVGAAGERGGGEVVVLGVCGEGGHAAGEVCPGGVEGQAGGEGDVDGCVVVPADGGGAGGGLPAEFEDQL